MGCARPVLKACVALLDGPTGARCDLPVGAPPVGAPLPEALAPFGVGSHTRRCSHVWTFPGTFLPLAFARVGARMKSHSDEIASHSEVSLCRTVDPGSISDTISDTDCPHRV